MTQLYPSEVTDVKKINLFFLIFIVFLLLQGCQPFLKAAMRGDTKTVLDELNRGADVNEKLSAGGGTALILAAEGGHLDTVKALIAKKADINIGDNGGNTALMKAAEKGHLDIVKALIDNKADVNGKNYVDNNALILSLYGGNSGVAKFLIDHGADCNAKNKYGRYPLYYAVNNGDAPIVRSLFDHGVKAGRQDKQLIDLVLEKNNEDIIGILLERNIDVGAKNNRGDATAPSASRKSVLSDVDELPMSKLRANKNSYAIVIGIENYRQKLPAADFATQDARLVSDYLVKVMGYPEENVITLLNDRASHVDMAKYFEKWLPNNVEPGSTVFVYYSGHGAPNPKTSDAYLVPYDGDPSFIEETGYSLKRMYAALGKLPAKEVIVALDSCFSGAGGR